MVESFDEDGCVAESVEEMGENAGVEVSAEAAYEEMDALTRRLMRKIIETAARVEREELDQPLILVRQDGKKYYLFHPEFGILTLKTYSKICVKYLERKYGG